MIVSTITMAACLLSSGMTTPPAARDSVDAIAVVCRFHAALASGDSAGALELLARDAIVLESGASETVEHYRSHHLPDDIEFARAVQTTHSLARVVTHGYLAWIASTSVNQGRFAGRRIDSVGAELVVLGREHGKWKIQSIHWSSRARRLGVSP